MEVSPSTIWITNLSDALEVRHLSDLFSAFGPVLDCQIVRDPQNVRLCVLTYAKPEMATAAKLMNGTTLSGQPLKVQISTEAFQESQKSSSNVSNPLALNNVNSYNAVPPPSSLSTGSLGSSAQSQPQTPEQKAQILLDQMTAANPTDPFLNSRTVYVGNVSTALTELSIKQFFQSKIGPVIATRLSGADVISAASRYCFVEFGNQLHAVMAMGLSGETLGDRQIKVGKANAAITGRTNAMVAQLNSSGALAIQNKTQQVMFDVSSAAANLDMAKVDAAMAKVKAAQALINAKMSGADPMTIATLQAASLLANENHLKAQAAANAAANANSIVKPVASGSASNPLLRTSITAVNETPLINPNLINGIPFTLPALVSPVNPSAPAALGTSTSSTSNSTSSSLSTEDSKGSKKVRSRSRSRSRKRSKSRSRSRSGSRSKSRRHRRRHRSRSRDRSKSRDRDREREKDKDKDKDKDKERDKDSVKDRDKDKDKEKDRSRRSRRSHSRSRSASLDRFYYDREREHDRARDRDYEFRKSQNFSGSGAPAPKKRPPNNNRPGMVWDGFQWNPIVK